jgi:CRISPR system Cascade subunit CasA
MERNLLEASWLTTTSHNGHISHIPVNGISDKSICGIAAPRADFKGALYQFLIGLLQTACTPSDRKAWLKWWNEPPGPNELEQAFAHLQEAFALDADNGKPAFMQDLNLPEGEEKGIAALLIEAPGGKTLRDNQDHFIKRGTVEKMSPWWAAMALFTLQINAPSGGVGHRVSLRGGGPLTTLVLPPERSDYDTLWHRLWLNVLTRDEVAKLPGNPELTDMSAIFPWLAKTRTSEKKGMETWPEQVHPMQTFWCMPRRIHLDWEDTKGGFCDIDGEPAEQVLNHYHTRNYGINYSGSWEHPLTPYVLEADKESISIKGQPGGLGYRHWLGLVLGERTGKQRKVPATVARTWKIRCDWLDEGTFEPRLWAFGYDMDNMKARCWCEATMPLFNLDDEMQRNDIHDHAQKMVHAAGDALKTLKSALKAAWFKRPKEAKGDISFIDANFWSTTEPAFYDLLRRQVVAIKQVDEEKQKALLTQWRYEIERRATTLFDQYALSSLNEDGDLRRVVLARDGKGGLIHYLRGSKILKQLAA